MASHSGADGHQGDEIELNDVMLSGEQERSVDIPKPKSARSVKDYEAVVTREETEVLPEPGAAGGGHALKRTGQLKKPPTRMRVLLSKLDTYAVKTSAPRIAGGLITLVIWLATMAYIAWTLYQWFNRPINIDNTIDWMMANGPFPLTVTCATRTGCYVSNNYMDPGMTGGVVANPEQKRCNFLEYQQNMTMDIIFSLNPEDGLAVLFDNEQTDVKNFGIITTSIVNCEAFKPDLPCTMDGVRFRNTRVSKGNNLANMVTINNFTRSDAGRTRMEWFMLSIDSKVAAPDPEVSTCVDTVNALPSATSYVQTRVIPNTNFVTSTVSRDDNWSDIFGIVGGGYELFVAVGAILLALVTLAKDGELDIFAAFAASGDV